MTRANSLHLREAGRLINLPVTHNEDHCSSRHSRCHTRDSVSFQRLLHALSSLNRSQGRRLDRFQIGKREPTIENGAQARNTSAGEIALCLKHEETRRQADEKLLFFRREAPFCKRNCRRS